MTPTVDACLPGITRGVVMGICREHEIPLEERNLSLAEVPTADECLTTGTMGELSPVVEGDGRLIGVQGGGPITRRLRDIYGAKTVLEGEKLPFRTLVTGGGEVGKFRVMGYR